MSVDAGQQRVEAAFGVGDPTGKPAVEPHPSGVGVDRTTDEVDTGALERGEVDRARAGPADQLQGRFPPGLAEIDHGVDRAVQGPDALQPPVDVHPAVGPREPGVTADSEGDVPSGGPQLGRQLCAGRGGADDQHAAGGEVIRTAVPVGGELVDVQPLGHAGDEGSIAPAGGDDDVGAPPRAGGRVHVEGVAGAAHRLDRHAVLDRGAERVGVPVEVAGEVGGGREAVLVGAGRAGAREDVEPVRGQQPQRVPRLAAPARPDLVALQHHVVVVGGGEVVTQRQPGLAGADHDGVDVRHGVPLRLVSGRSAGVDVDGDRHAVRQHVEDRGPSAATARRPGAACRARRPRAGSARGSAGSRCGPGRSCRRRGQGCRGDPCRPRSSR